MTWWLMTRRRCTRTGPTGNSADPDREVFARAARDIAMEIAVLCAGMVIAGAAVLFGALWMEATRHNRRDPRSGALLVRLDPDDVTGLVLVVTIGVLVVAGVGTLAFVRRAIRPLEESMRRQRTFVADASHELRTPLAVASARSQQLALMARGDDDLEVVARSLHSDIGVMTGIVNDMLASLGPEPTTPTDADLGAVLTRVVADMEVLARERAVGIGLDAGAAAGRRVGLPESELRRALTAVVDNAVGFSPRGGTVRVLVEEVGSTSEVRVSDDGPGITGIAPARVFERFAHGTPPSADDPTRTSHGIGLALAHDLVTSRGGTITVESTGPAGTTILLRLPGTTHGPSTGQEGDR